MRRVPRLHVITNDEVLARAGFLETALRLIGLDGGRIAFHVRGHATPAATLYETTSELRAATHPPAMLLVNDRVDIALATGADGIQLGGRSLPVKAVRSWIDRRPSTGGESSRSGDAAGAPSLIGFSAHDVESAVRATEDGADLVLAGTIWASATHPDAPPAGTGLIEAIARNVRRPVIAIGGVGPERVAEARFAGAHGVAVIGYIWDGAWPRSPERACGELLAALDEADTNTDPD